MSENAQANIEARLNDLRNVLRIVQNTFNLVSDVDVKGAHCNAVAEIMGWLKGFGQTLQTQITALEATLPRPVEPVKESVKEPIKEPEPVESPK